MSRQIPEPIRAYVGLAATVLDEARKLPEALPGLPVRAVGLAMQTALKLQQQWAGLVARGDEVLTGFRGEDEPGLATFDDDDDVPAASARASAFDRAAADVPDDIVDDEISGLAAVPDPIEVVETLQDITDQVVALDEVAAVEDAEAVLTPEDALETALLETDGAPASDTAADTAAAEVTEVDVLTPDGEVETVEATVTDEAIAAPETPADLEPADAGTAPVTEADADTTTDDQATAVDAGTAPVTEADADTITDDQATAVDEGGSPVAVATGGSTDTDAPAAKAPVAGYDGWTVAQLRGRLRGYQLSTVADLLAYEESSRAREPFLRMLRNRLEKLERQAVEASPLAPRGM
jgi:hypothetical protein